MDNQNIPAGQTISPVPPQTTSQTSIPAGSPQAVPQGHVTPTPSQTVTQGNIPPVSPQTMPQNNIPLASSQTIPQGNTPPVSTQAATQGNIPPISPGEIPQMNIPPRQLVAQPVQQRQTPLQSQSAGVLSSTPQTQTIPPQPAPAASASVQPPSPSVQPQVQTTLTQPEPAQTPPKQPTRDGGRLDIPQRHSSRQAPEADNKPQKNKRRKLRVFRLFLFLLLIGAVGLLVHLYKGAKQEIADREADIKELETQLDDESARADAADADLQEYIEKVKKFGAEDDVNLTFMRHMFPDMVVLPAEGGFAYYPINKDLKMAEYDYSALKTSSSGVKSYVPDNIRSSYAGIDVSTFQGDIAWKKVAEDNIDYAMIRLGYRGYGNGTLVLDDTYKKNIKGATKNGLDVGVYFFTQAVNAKEAKEEAEFVLKNLKGYKVNYPVVIDTEMIESGKSRGNALTPEERTETIKVFCDTIKEAGYTPMVYANLTWFITALDVSQLEDYEKWFAGYETEPSYPYAFSMWQYTSSGTVKGIKGAVDRNISFVNYAQKE